MTKYILMIIWPMILYVISRAVKGVYETDRETGLQSDRFTRSFAIFSVLPYIYWAAVRPTWFGDTGVYARTFWELPIRFGDAVTYIQDVGKDPGFYALSIVIKMMNTLITGTPNFRVYFAVIAIIQIVPLVLVLRRYSASMITSLFVFAASSDYISWMHNGVRQFTAVVIVFAASSFLFDGKYIRYAAAIGFASLFHLSAIMMIPISFIARGKPWRIKTFLIITGLALALIYIGNVTDWLDDTLEGTQYEDVVTNWETGGDDGTNPLRVLVYSMPTILSLIGLRYIREADDEVINIACNMSIIGTLIYIFSIFTSGIYIGRLPIYFTLYGMEILLPWEIGKMFADNSAKIVNIIMVVAFMLFYHFQLHHTWGLY